ncbi:BACON domain-containing protein [Dysgonomonas sp. 511]|uniref:BACON domain-containing protein n=1 Tax=Dysgonomonas sp. 511 TaxID=2302930 RepID=UPI0013D74DCC|nr:BACON domain-containing protein [Dysgonomonas sp. 511]NDV78736.1 hypothetical protein [Dysgonomonas sp. 511]
MKVLFKISITCLLLGLAFAFTACEDEDVNARKSGQNRSYSISVGSGSGSASFNISANSSWNLSMDAATESWASIQSGTSGNGNSTIEVNYTENKSFNRLGRIYISIPDVSVVDTLYLRQFGQLPVLEFVAKEFEAHGFGAKAIMQVSTNLPDDLKDRISLEVDYKSEVKDWITDFGLTQDLTSASFTVTKNASSSDRTANVNLVFTDEWGEKHISSCMVIQSRQGGTENTQDVSFETVRALISASSGSIEITDDISISGFVISDCENPNVAANPNITTSTINYDANYTTAYVQNAAAQYGFALTTDTKDANIMHRYDNLKLWLKGLMLVKESNPERYTIKGITNINYITLDAGTASNLAKKEKYINDLTDADLYTFVTLKDCELPIRKGPFTPINEGYGVAYAVYRVDMYPLVIRDSKGGSSHLMTNLGCPYRRDGSVLPQGSGDISGIIVHEKYERFDLGGDIGKYQIRHLTREDINVAQSADNSFSKVICEWTKFQGTSKIVTPTSGSGELSQTYSTGNIYGTQDYTYLGPITGKTADDNKGVIPSAQGQGIAKTYWWNGTSGESWVIKFSTKGISSSQLSLQFTAFHNGLGAPRYWTIETSTHGNQSGVWDKVKDYTVPDVVQWSNTLYNQISGLKNIDASLPASLMGQENVYVRLRVTQNKAGTAASYDGTAINNATATVLSYVSVRYNK